MLISLVLRASGFIESGLLGDVGFRVSFARRFGVAGSRHGFLTSQSEILVFGFFS